MDKVFKSLLMTACQIASAICFGLYCHSWLVGMGVFFAIEALMPFVYDYSK